jgi:hypothetical protein
MSFSFTAQVSSLKSSSEEHVATSRVTGKSINIILAVLCVILIMSRILQHAMISTFPYMSRVIK